MEASLLNLDLQAGRSRLPKHERLRRYFVTEMIAGRLKAGQRLPSEPQLARGLHVAKMTVRQAMDSLAGDGLIRRVPGSGTFVADNARRKLKPGLDLFALVVPQTHGGFYPSLLAGFEGAASEVHHQTVICATDNEVPRQAEIVLQLIDKQVGGVAFVPASDPFTPTYQIRQLQQQGIPVVLCHRVVVGITAPLLAVPFHEKGRLAGKALADHGHRHVAMIGYHPTPSTKSVYKGFLEGLRGGGGESVELVFTGGSSVTAKEELVWATLQQVFAGAAPPTAIFTTFDPLAKMIYFLMPRLGLRVPEDVSLVAFGDTCRTGAFVQRLTSVVVDEIAAGRQAALWLHEMRSGDRPIEDNEEMVLSLRLSEGETLAIAATRKQRVS